MSDFPGYVEATCPCCLRYRHYKEGKIPENRIYIQPGKKVFAVCDDCWRIVSHFVCKALKPCQTPSAPAAPR